MLVRTDAVATILASTEGYVMRFVTLIAHGLIVPALTRTQACDVTRLDIQETVKTLQRTAHQYLESTSSLILLTKHFLFSATWSQHPDMFGHWYNHFPWLITLCSKTRCLELIPQWIMLTMMWSGTCTACPYNRCGRLLINQHTSEQPVTSQKRVCNILTTHAPSWKLSTYLEPIVLRVYLLNT